MSWKNGGGSKNFSVIAEDDNVDIPPTEYVHVETAGNLVVKNRAGVTVTLVVNAGDVIPIGVCRLMAATSCGQVVGFWDE